MLYVSRLIGYSKVGVVDTETGDETIYDRGKLVDMIEMHGIEVTGASFWTQDGKLSIMSAPEPYQLPETVTRLQTKYNMLCGVDFRVYKGMLTRIIIRAEDIQTPVKVRLSEICDRVGDYVLFGNQAVYDEKLELIFDDKIKSVTPKSFRVDVGILSALGMGVTFDLQELHDDMLAENIYSALAGDYCKPSTAIVDSQERVMFMAQLYGGKD